ncbi:MAG: C25 family cysteine peptidase, partial [Mycobacteriales bacterium]
EIKGIVDAYRGANPGLKYVVIAGNDNAIPFFRYPDQSLLGQESGYVPPVLSTSASEASLRNDYVLSQDAYGSSTQISLRTSTLPVPGLAVGRLVETVGEIAGMIDAFLTNTSYTSNGVVSPRTALVTGYDFLADAAHAVNDELASGIGNGYQPDKLITESGISPEDPRSWTATALGQALLGSRHDLVFLAGHFSANSALAADFATSLITTDLAASQVDLTNALVWSAGCHSGYNLVDADKLDGVTLPLDWVQAFAQKKATLIAGTGYQYGDTEFLEYSERLYANFARQLRAGDSGTDVKVGEALVKAKLDYLAATPDMRGIHEKAFLEATLFGLPMLGINMPSGRGAVVPPGPTISPQLVPSGPANSLGLRTAEITVSPTTLVEHLLELRQYTNTSSVPPTWVTTNATWLTDGLAGATISNPAEPVLPLIAVNVTPIDPPAPAGKTVLRGVGFTGGTFSDTTTIPLTGAPTTELRGVHVPFVSPVFYPMRPWSINYSGALAGNGSTSLLVTPVQHRAEDIARGTSTRRAFGNMGLRLYYSGNLGSVALSDAPSIVSVLALSSGGTTTFSAQVVGDPKASIYETWITYTGAGLNAWTSVPLAQCVATAATPLPVACGGISDSRRWKVTMPDVAGLRYIIQAASGTGLVTLDDNRGAYYQVGGLGETPTATTIVSAPSIGTFGGTADVTVALASGGSALAGKNVIVSIGGAARAGLTDAFGKVMAKVPLVSVPGNYPVIASFGGDENFQASSATAAVEIAIAKAQTNLATVSLSIGAATVGAQLIASLGTGQQQALIQEAVTFVVSGTNGTKTIVAITDYLGRAPLPPTGLPAGTYTLTATFAGNATYTGATGTGTLTIAAQSITFSNGGLPSTLPYPGSVTFTVASGTGESVTVKLSPASSGFCTLSGTGPTYTLTAVSPGTCQIVASVGATTTTTAVEVTATVTIVKGAQAITFAPLPDKTWGDPDFNVAASGGASGNPATFSSQTTSVCTTSGTNGATVHLVDGGPCTIAANQAGNGFYDPAPPVLQTFTVKPAAQSITAISFNPATPIFTTLGTFTVSATTTSGLVASFTSITTGTCTVAGSTVTMLAAGLCTIQADQAGSSKYAAAVSLTASTTIGKGSQSITFAPISDQTYTGPATQITVSATAVPSGLAVSFAASGSCAISGSNLAPATVALMSTGTCSITASQAGDGNWLPAAVVTQSFAI